MQFVVPNRSNITIYGMWISPDLKINSNIMLKSSGKTIASKKEKEFTDAIY